MPTAFARHLLFLPSVTFGLLSAEIFPWAFIYAVFHLRRITKATFCLLIVLLISSLHGYYTVANANQPESSDVLRSLFAYMNFVLIFECILQANKRQIQRLQSTATNALYIFLLIGIGQHFDILAPLTDSIRYLVPRAEGGALLEMGGRGVTLLSSEPARAGLELVFLYCVTRLCREAQRWDPLYDLLFLAYLALIIKSASATLFCLIALAALNIRRPVTLGALLAGLLVGALITTGDGGNRTITLVSSLLDMNSAGDVLFFFANEAGHRIIALIAFVNEGVHTIIGHGVGSWKESSLLALEHSGFSISEFRYFQLMGGGNAIHVRAPGVIPNLFLDAGIIGVGVLAFWVFTKYRKAADGTPATRIALFILLIKISFFGSLGEPIPWIAAAIVFRYSRPVISAGNSVGDRWKVWRASAGVMRRGKCLAPSPHPYLRSRDSQGAIA